MIPNNIKRRGFSIILFCVLALTLSGCGEKTDELKTSILDQAQTTVDSVKDTATSIQEQAVKTKASVEQKVEDVQNAAKQVQEAVDAVKKVTE